MYSKQFTGFVRYFVRAIIVFVLKMCNRSTNNNQKPSGYVFKPFSFKVEVFSKENKETPPPRSGHRIGANSANFYSFGGYNPLIRIEDYHYLDDTYIDSYPLFREMWKFNYASKKWTKFKNVSTLPKELVSNAVFLYHNILMVYGGTGSPFGTRCSNQLYICNISEETNPMMEVKTTGQFPLPQYGQAIVYYNDYLYAIGGTTGFDYTCDIHRLNLKTLVWEVVYLCNGSGSYEPPGRYRHEIGFDGKKIFVLAGGTSETVYDFNEIPAFDIDQKVWSSEKTIPAGTLGVPMARRCHGAAQIDHGNGIEVFIAGGLDGSIFFRDLWRINLKTMQWTCFETCYLPLPTYFHAMSVTPEGRLYIFGGIHCLAEEVRRSNAVYSTWVCVPKLSELCWEALLHYSPDIFNYASDDLIDMGMPRHFVQRLN